MAAKTSTARGTVDSGNMEVEAGKLGVNLVRRSCLVATGNCLLVVDWGLSNEAVFI